MIRTWPFSASVRRHVIRLKINITVHILSADFDWFCQSANQINVLCFRQLESGMTATSRPSCTARSSITPEETPTGEVMELQSHEMKFKNKISYTTLVT